MDAVTINYKAQNLVPYEVVNFEAEKNGSGDINFSWVRSSCEFSAMRDYIDVPLNDGVEKYNISIIDGSDEVVRQVDTNSGSFDYTNAMQVTDFGSSQNSIKAIVYQYSDKVGRGAEITGEFSF